MTGRRRDCRVSNILSEVWHVKWHSGPVSLLAVIAATKSQKEECWFSLKLGCSCTAEEPLGTTVPVAEPLEPTEAFLGWEAKAALQWPAQGWVWQQHWTSALQKEGQVNLPANSPAETLQLLLSRVGCQGVCGETSPTAVPPSHTTLQTKPTTPQPNSKQN